MWLRNGKTNQLKHLVSIEKANRTEYLDNSSGNHTIGSVWNYLTKISLDYEKEWIEFKTGLIVRVFCAHEHSIADLSRYVHIVTDGYFFPLFASITKHQSKNELETKQSVWNIWNCYLWWFLLNSFDLQA